MREVIRSSVYGSPANASFLSSQEIRQRHNLGLEKQTSCIDRRSQALPLCITWRVDSYMGTEISFEAAGSSFVRSPLSSSCSWKHLLFDGRDDASFLLSRFSLFRLSYTAIQERSWKTEYRPSLLVKHNKPFLWSTSWPLGCSTEAEKQEQKSYVPIYTCRNISK